jgi:D-alanyl-D-alanine dipeptidase
VFALGAAYGRAATAAQLALDYASESATLRCVDDPASAHYNRIVDAATLTPDWASAEPMREFYELAIVIEHNLARDHAAGSCIFLHRWRDAQTPVSGCTAMDAARLDTLARWLEPGAIMVSLPRSELAELGPAWGLPRSW